MFDPQFAYMKNPEYQITQGEKDFAVQHLSKTRDNFVNAIRGLSEAQWYFKPATDKWNAAQCAQHVLETELYYFMPTIEKMLAEEAAPEKKKEAFGKDEASYKSMEDRTYKIKGQPWEEQENKKVDKEGLISAFVNKRNEIIEWLKNSDEEFRAHFTVFPGLETIDVYQFILFISGHTTRHTGQIQDISQVPGFPN
jgi:uncharacterized damage-inducible protein DinB